MGGPGDIARAAGPGASFVDCLMHGAQHCRMLTHPQIIVGAPNGYRAFAVRRAVNSIREFALFPQNICEYAVTSFKRQSFECFPKPLLIVHSLSLLRGMALYLGPDMKALAR